MDFKNVGLELQYALTTWPGCTQEVRIVGGHMWRAEAALGQWIDRQAGVLFHAEAASLNNCTMQCLPPGLQPQLSP